MPHAPAADPSCVFCRIVKGEIPCWKLYEDDRVLSFLDIGPLSEGHLLVIPKGHYTTIDQMPADLVSACAVLLPAMAKALMAANGMTAWNILQNNGSASGQVVPHVHFHIIPRQEGDGLGFRWPAGKLDEPTAERLTAAIHAELTTTIRTN